jgi:Leucine-rich repeat (LRR) protein
VNKNVSEQKPIDSIYLSNLLTLDLGLNGISQLNASVFRGLENLEELHLDRNKLTKIESDSFQHLKKLKKLCDGPYERFLEAQFERAKV